MTSVPDSFQEDAAVTPLQRKAWERLWRYLLPPGARLDDTVPIAEQIAEVEAWTADGKPDATVPDLPASNPAPQPKSKRTSRLKPSSIAAFEAQWQAEHADDEAES